MKVLFDQCTPEALRKELTRARHTGPQTRRESVTSENGDLIDEAARRGYDLLVTADRRMQKQQEHRSGNPCG